MEDPRHAQGPAKNVLGIGQRILTTLVGIAETRVRLAVVELEEEKANLFQMLLMLGLTMLFAAFGLMSLMVLIIWAIDPQYRLNAMIATTVVLVGGGLVGVFSTLTRRPSCAIRARSWPTTAPCWRMISRERQSRTSKAKAYLLSQSSSSGWICLPAVETGLKPRIGLTAAGTRSWPALMGAGRQQRDGDLVGSAS